MDPEMWRDPAVAKMTRDERLMFVGLITIADDEGRLNASPAALQGALYPNDTTTTPRAVRKWRDGLVAKLANVQLYEHQGVEYISLRRWERYQKPSHPTPSKLPKPSRVAPE
jgi:hypothetical protein